MTNAGHHLRFIALLSFSFFIHSSSAEEVRIPIGEQNDAQVQKPRKGMMASTVERAFGEPSSIHGPVGSPPISYWEYKNFTVYFEGNHVVHAVSKIKSTKVFK